VLNLQLSAAKAEVARGITLVCDSPLVEACMHVAVMMGEDSICADGSLLKHHCGNGRQRTLWKLQLWKTAAETRRAQQQVLGVPATRASCAVSRLGAKPDSTHPGDCGHSFRARAHQG
jgi:hypothetical protein